MLIQSQFPKSTNPSVFNQPMHTNVPELISAVGEQDKYPGMRGHLASPMPSSNSGPMGATINDVPAVGPALVPIHSQGSWQLFNQDHVSAASTQECLLNLPIPPSPKPAVPPPVAPPHSPEQHAEVLRMSKKYGLDTYSETRIRDPISEIWSGSVSRDHMVKLYMEADKDNWNKTNPQWLRIQIANVSNHLLKLAEDCGSYPHCHQEK